jgi:methylated-DNA-[protein]-cysteine S-methyltransferase
MSTNPKTTETWHTLLPTTLGELTLVRDADAVLGLYYPRHWYLPDRASFGPRSDDGFEEVVRQLEEYLAGRRRTFELALAPHGDQFQHSVWDLVARVPYGHTVTYGDLATRLGRGTTPQEVGAAVGRNPSCIFIPCHRVVGWNNKLTGYAGGLTRKRALLDLEQSSPAALQEPQRRGCGRRERWPVRPELLDDRLTLRPLPPSTRRGASTERPET